ncbi:50S ribosome-binding protein YggL [Roseisolibacter sp. H3M3-2]|uniref:50S ribosome-binding protein YggL n=1 Tax=Roseisolibacter sp. H3M3-2 TaxID=3031323 RepID=UPI0023DB2B9B|nr:50S ribosome-binding protein YggL [Roseisolibacter sp. H3M3-2]MDF1505819.1 50S ribosome-binding protein YggL [Roseisolibacter sp. H3M3-2]
MSAACPEYGFAVTLTPDPALAPADRDALRADLARLLAMRGVDAGGARGGAAWRLVVTRDGGQATDGDRGAARAWAAARPELAAFEVGDLVDLGEPGAV